MMKKIAVAIAVVLVSTFLILNHNPYPDGIDVRIKITNSANYSSCVKNELSAYDEGLKIENLLNYRDKWIYYFSHVNSIGSFVVSSNNIDYINISWMRTAGVDPAYSEAKYANVSYILTTIIRRVTNCIDPHDRYTLQCTRRGLYDGPCIEHKNLGRD